MNKTEEELTIAEKNQSNLYDRALAVEIRNGDEKALEKLIRRHGALFRTVVARILNNNSDVDEVVSDAIYEIWKKIDSFDPTKGAFLGWMITSVRRRAIDRVRRMSAYSRARDRFEIENVAANRAHQRYDTGEISNTDKHRRLLELLHSVRIPDKQRDCLILHYLEGMSQCEIARQLGRPLGTVKTQLELGFGVIQALVLSDRMFKKKTEID